MPETFFMKPCKDCSMKHLLLTANKDTLLGLAVHQAVENGASETSIITWLTSQNNDNPEIMQDIFPAETCKKLFA
jgi:hypothetical protein